MPILISYSHANSTFAEQLAEQIYMNGSNIWIDKWQLVPGDSIYEGIQEALAKATAVIAILSKESVESLWCKREIATAMTRELRDKKTLVIPALLDDCEIPLFLQDKMYADFRKDFDVGMNSLMTAINKFGNPRAGRAESDNSDFLNDYSYEYRFEDGKLNLTWHLFQHSNKLPISVYSLIEMQFNEAASHRWLQFKIAGFESFGELVLVEWACMHAHSDEWHILLEGPEAKTQRWTIKDKQSQKSCSVKFTCRRLGDDIGYNTAIRGHYEFEKILEMMRTRVKKPSPKEMEKIMAVIQSA